ncbi:serpin B4-like [Candoia aspera]|uniref:serpin B4-like n=1 Tax=Candoia aspera TaxID=51853 RepID=UPI002FD86A60
MTSFPEANAKFASYLFHRLSEAHFSDNVLVSPINAANSLGLLLLASRNEQANELEKVLHWDEMEDSDRCSNRRHLEAARSSGRSTAKLRAQERSESCPNTSLQPQPHPEPAHPKPKPKPEPEPSPSAEKNAPDSESETPKEVHTAFSRILAVLNKPNPNYTLSFASKFYGDYAVSFLQKFIYNALKLYLTDVVGANIHNAPEEVRKLINLWTEVQTHGEIKELFPKDSFDSLAQLLLVNVLYFKGQWDIKFDKEITTEAPFYAHDSDHYTVQLMQRKGIYNTAITDIANVQVQVLEIPYKNNELSFFILLPTDYSTEALQQLEDGLSYKNLLDWPWILKPEEVAVSIPKFSLEKSLYLDELLDLLNLSDSERANFSGATTTEGVTLTRFLHDTFIEIDEDGGEEAGSCCFHRHSHQEPVKFMANHPFIFYLLHKSTESILALGRFAKPE